MLQREINGIGRQKTRVIAILDHVYGQDFKKEKLFGWRNESSEGGSHVMCQERSIPGRENIKFKVLKPWASEQWRGCITAAAWSMGKAAGVGDVARC